jgi:hypothetical protein
MISKAMFDLMMHMIGYGNLADNFKDVMSENYKDEYDEELIFELATWCDDRYGTRIVRMLSKLTEE